METRRKIALLAGQPDENYQSLFIKGFLKQAFLCDYDVCIFAMYQKYQDSAAREQGEAYIFELPQYDMFDAIVILSDSIQTPGLLEHIEENIHNSYDKPVICVDQESKYFQTVMTDHYMPAKQLVAHLIEEHGYTDIAYVTGRKAHPHSIQRLQGYIDCMKEHNLEVSENRIFYGDFWYSSGLAVAEQLLRDREHLPQAVACANDCMAIGLAGELVKAGIRVPEDIAITGYDVLPEGRTSPKPITSAPIPAGDCGAHVVRCLEASFAGEKMPEFHATVDLFLGRSCGCNWENKDTLVKLRDTWETERYMGNLGSTTDHIADDLLIQTDTNGLFNTIFSYIHQISPFTGFHICMNTDWLEKNAGGTGYTEAMLHVLECGEGKAGNSRVDLSAVFERKLLLPELHRNHEQPQAYFFTPIFSENRCFGYAVLTYGNEVKCYGETYRQWMGIVMRGLETFRRVKLLQEENALLKSGQIRDSLTGYYNYNGFMENAASLLTGPFAKGSFVNIIAIEFCGWNEVYAQLGLQSGNQVLIDCGQLLADVIGKRLSGCLEKGEFLAALFTDREVESDIKDVQKHLEEKLDLYAEEIGFQGKLTFVCGGSQGRAESQEEFENLLNKAISNKNGNKVKAQKNSGGSLTLQEQREAGIVNDILDNNRFLYHFQPIVDAKTGEIFAYEALMRADTKQAIAPLKILKYAEFLGRLYDVERATFLNILKYIKEHEEHFKNKKVFINSIPGNRLKDKDAFFVHKKLERYQGKVVVELTEQAELDDDELASMKAEYERIGIETAVDDYGTGYSNITNLLRYMPRYVKIDRMLLTDIHLSPQKQHFVKEIVSFAHDNQIKVLAEGVETSEELREVISLGAHLIQGYYTAKPSAVVLQELPLGIQNEIIQYSHQFFEQNGSKVYDAGQEGKISLVKLASGHYSRIQFEKEKLTHRDVVIAGLPGFQSEMDIVIGDSYSGRIELQDVHLSKHKKQPAIRIGEHCDVTLVLTGDNILEHGGILVPETSTLTVQGDGNLAIRQIEVDGYGIGNGKEQRHGDLSFDQDGTIEISGNTMHGVGIGSGCGGNIYINRGKYVMDFRGQEAVGIGALYADVNYTINRCDIEINIANATGIGVGSLTGNAELHIAYASIKEYMGGHESTGIGTLQGEACYIDIREAAITIDMRSASMCGIGCHSGSARIQIESALCAVTAQGKQAIAMGNLVNTAKIYMKDADLDTNVKNHLDMDIGADVFEIVNARCRCRFNGEELARRDTREEL